MFLRIAIRRAMSTFLVASSMAAGGAHAQSKEVINAETITYFPPYEFKEPGSTKLVGFDIELFEAMAAKMGTKVNWVESSYAQLMSWSSLKTNRADIAIAVIADTPERREAVNFLDYMYINRVFYTLTANASRFANMDALCGKRVGAARGSSTEMGAVVKWSDENCVKSGKPAIELVPGENTPQVRLMLQQNRIDAAMTAATPLAYQNALEGNKFAVIGKPVEKALTGVSFPKDDPKLGEALKKALAALIADGTYHGLMRKWGLADYEAIEQPMINGQP